MTTDSLATWNRDESRPGTKRHRRIIHLEYSGAMELPDHLQWHDFIPLQPNPFETLIDREQARDHCE